jgi:hypothetical protein
MAHLIAVRRTLVAVALAPVLLTGLVACGSDSGDTHETGSDTSQSAPDPGVEPGDSVEPADFSDLLADGFASITTAHATLDGDFGTGDLTGEGDVDYSADQPAMAMTLDSELFGSGGAEARLVDGAMYLNLGQLSQDKFWKLDLDDPDSPFGALGSQIDPKSSVELLEKGLTSVEYVGEEDSLDHYRAVVDPKALLERLGPMASSGASSLPKSIDYDIWLDDENRLNKLTFAMGDAASLEMTLSDFGADVSVEAPPADEVTEMPDVFSNPSIEPQV